MFDVGCSMFSLFDVVGRSFLETSPYGVLWPPLGGFSRILIEGLTELIPFFAKVSNRFRKILCIVGKYPGKFIATRLAEVLLLEIGVFFLAGSYDSIKKMATHKFIICDAVKFVAFHPIVFIEITIGKVNFAATPHIDAQSQISMDDPLNFSILANFEQHILSVGLKQVTKIQKTFDPVPDDREHDIFQDELLGISIADEVKK